MTTARTKAATTSASFGTRILTQCIPGPVSGGCAESNRDARECGLKTRGLRSTLELEAGKFYRRWGRLADLTAWPTLRPNRHFASLQGPPIMPADSMALASFNPSIPICRERVVSVQRQEDPAACVFANQTKLLLSRLLAKSVAVGDEITFPISVPDAVGLEILITKNAASGLSRYIYQAPIGYVSQPKQDKRNEHFVSAEINRGSLGIRTIFLPCEVLHEYFYRLPRTTDRVDHPTLYEVLRIQASASPSELRVAFKLRDLELRTASVRHRERLALERAFNIVGQPALRACYDALLADPEAPAVFPYGGFGSLLVAGDPSRDGQTFFARRIIAFSPDLRRRRFHVPLRKCDFYDDRALCRDVRRKLEFWLDPAALHTLWDRTWNQWKLRESCR